MLIKLKENLNRIFSSQELGSYCNLDSYYDHQFVPIASKPLKRKGSKLKASEYSQKISVSIRL